MLSRRGLSRALGVDEAEEAVNRLAQLTALFLVVMVVTAMAIAWWTRRIYGKFPAAAGAKWHVGYGSRHLIGCTGFFLMPVALLAFFWPIALLFGLVFLALAVRRLGRPGRAYREIAGVSWSSAVSSG